MKSIYRTFGSRARWSSLDAYEVLKELICIFKKGCKDEVLNYSLFSQSTVLRKNFNFKEFASKHTKFWKFNEIVLNALSKIDFSKIFNTDLQGSWWNQILCNTVNHNVLLWVVQGEFAWHKHEDEDEFFLVLYGKLFIDTEFEKDVEVKPNEGYLVQRGVLHQTRVSNKTIALTSSDPSNILV